MSFQATKSNDEYEEVTYEANLVSDDKKCAHFFKRVASNKVECIKCHIGYMDAGDFPIEDLNLYYQGEKTREYYRNL